jgi:hypothetical protein
MMSILSFCAGSLVGLASGFVLGVDYGRRHSEPWRDLGETVGDFATWAKSTLTTPTTVPVNEPPAVAGSFTATGGVNQPQA